MHGRWTYTSREVCGRRWMLKAAVCMCVLLCGQLLVTSCGVVMHGIYLLAQNTIGYLSLSLSLSLSVFHLCQSFPNDWVCETSTGTNKRIPCMHTFLILCMFIIHKTLVFYMHAHFVIWDLLLAQRKWGRRLFPWGREWLLRLEASSGEQIKKYTKRTSRQ